LAGNENRAVRFPKNGKVDDRVNGRANDNPAPRPFRLIKFRLAKASLLDWQGAFGQG
jgi:hypothetical protein